MLKTPTEDAPKTPMMPVSENRAPWAPSGASSQAPITDLRTRQPVATCAVCHEAMKVVEPGQTTHPGCEPGGAA